MTWQQTEELSMLLRAVCAARTRVDEVRRAKMANGGPAVTLEQRALLLALEEYADALSLRGSPLPYRMRNDVTMYRAMFGSRAESRTTGGGRQAGWLSEDPPSSSQ